RNTGRVAVLSGEITFSAVSISPHDAEFVEQRKLSTAEIARLFGVMPWMVNAPSNDSMTYSNVEQQMRAFLGVSLPPYLVAIEQAVTNDADLCPGPNVFVEHLRDAILQADSLARAQIYTAALNKETGWMTRAEVRERENLSPEGAAS